MKISNILAIGLLALTVSANAYADLTPGQAGVEQMMGPGGPGWGGDHGPGGGPGWGGGHDGHDGHGPGGPGWGGDHGPHGPGGPGWGGPGWGGPHGPGPGYPPPPPNYPPSYPPSYPPPPPPAPQVITRQIIVNAPVGEQRLSVTDLAGLNQFSGWRITAVTATTTPNSPAQTLVRLAADGQVVAQQVNPGHELALYPDRQIVAGYNNIELWVNGSTYIGTIFVQLQR
ncbi:MAG: hypothetical protein ACXWPX_10190 [Pseudobdellovibrio sp.]